MSGRYQVELKIGKQEDGLWRVQVPDFHGVWVDAPTLNQATAEIQEVIAMAVDDYREQGWELPSSVSVLQAEPTTAVLPVIAAEHPFDRVVPRTKGRKRSA